MEHLLSPTAGHSPGSLESPPIKRRKYSTSPNMDMPDFAHTPRPQKADTFSWDNDPFAVDPSLTQSCLKSFFKHFNEQLYSIFPQQKFLDWAYGGRTKSAHDKLLLYSMMALGTVFSAGAPHELQELFAGIVEQNVHSENYLPTLQVVQARLFMTMFRFSRGELTMARDTCASVMRMAMGLRLNTEPTVMEPLCFGLDDSLTRECRRRTFWTAYMIDSTLHYCVEPTARVPAIECELRLPCDDEVYSRGLVGATPFAKLKGSICDVPLSPLSSQLAKVIGITTIMREIISYLQCLRGLQPGQVRNTQMHFQEGIIRRLEQWRQQVIGRSAQQGLAAGKDEDERLHYEAPSPLMLLLHFAKILLFRHLRHDLMTREQVEASVRGARHEAHELLELLLRLGERNSGNALTTVCPITGFATFIAVDVITAAGFMSSAMENNADHHHSTHPAHMEVSFMDLLQAGLMTLDSLGLYWTTAKRQAKQVKSRFFSFMSARNNLGNHKEAYYIESPMYSPFGMEQDVLYGLRKTDLFNILGVDESSVAQIPEGVQSP